MALMNFQIQELLINSNQLNWLHTLSSGFFGALLGGLISGGITFWAMKAVDNENKKRWLNNGYLKRKIELEVEIIKYIKYLQGICLVNINFEDMKNFYASEITDKKIEKLKKFNEFYEHFIDILNFQEYYRTVQYKNIRLLTLFNEYEFYDNNLNEKISNLGFLLNYFSENRSLHQNNTAKASENCLFGFDKNEIMDNKDKIQKTVNYFQEFSFLLEDIIIYFKKNKN